MKCIVSGCVNVEREIPFVGHLCAFCYRVISTGEIDPHGKTFIHKERERYLYLARLAEELCGAVELAMQQVAELKRRAN